MGSIVTGRHHGLGSSGTARIKAHLTLLKPKITLLLTAVGGVAAAVAAATTGTALDAGRLVWLCVLGLAAAGAAATLNHLFDRDIDVLMRRTRNRPIPTGLVTPRAAAVQAAVLLACAVPLAYLLLGPVPALFIALGAAIYGGFYTLFLKRNTARNIEIGGLAGSCGAIAGWAIVDPGLGAGAWLFGALVFAWTPAHFWGLAVARDADYRATKLPMMPQVAGVAATARLMTVYAVLTLAASVALVPATSLGLVYGAVAVVSGGFGLLLCARFQRSLATAWALRVFKFSGGHLALLVVGMLLDLVVVRGLG